MDIFSNAKRYSSANSIYATDLVTDFLEYKGIPTSGEYSLPISTNPLGYSVISNLAGITGVALTDGKNLSYFAPNVIRTSSANLNVANYFNDTVCINFVTTNFLAYVPQATGTAYRLKKHKYLLNDTFSPKLILEKIGSLNEVREKYNDEAVVLTRVDKYVDTAIPRPLANNAHILSVSDCFGSYRYYANGIKYPDHSTQHNKKDGGYFLAENFYQVSGTTIDSNAISWLSFYEKMGADVVVFTNSTDDKTGSPPDGSGYKLCIIFKSEKEVKTAGNNVGIPFVINDTETVRYKDIKEFKDYIAPGVPDNETGGGNGLGNNISDNVDNPLIPQLSPVSGGNNVYCMNSAELDKTFQFLWDGHNKEILGITISEANIVDCLCNCFYLPFDIQAHDTGHCIAATVEAGGYSSDIQSTLVLSGYNKRFDFGDLKIEEYYGSFLDYSPYTAISIYLPYIGFKALDVSKCMGKTINVTYGVDFAQGIATAYLSYYEGDNKQVFAEYSGQMGIPVKVTGKNTSPVENAVKDAAFSLAGLAVAAIAVAATPATGGASLAATGLAASSIANFGAKTYTAATVQADSVSVGNAGAENWLLSPQGCYVYIQRARTATPENFADINGWATRYTGLVSEFTGYLECSEVVNTVNTTAEEKNLITNLLKQGVYV